MLSNILVIFCIIGLSYVFKMNEKMNFDNQILFIFLCISLLVFYKFMIVKEKKNESFQEEKDKESVEDAVTGFAEGRATTEDLDLTERSETMLKLSKLEEILLEHESRLEDLKKSKTDRESDLKTDQKKTEDAMITLEEDLKKINSRIYETTKQESSDNYKKIPVYNSCILNAAGEIEHEQNNVDKTAVEYAREEVVTKTSTENDNINLKNLLNNITKNGLQINLK